MLLNDPNDNVGSINGIKKLITLWLKSLIDFGPLRETFMDKTKWSVWKNKPVPCFFCEGDIQAGDAYRLEVFYVADILTSLVDGKERSVYKPISKRVHADCERIAVE